MLIPPVCVRAVLPNLSQLPGWTKVQRWQLLRHSTVRLYPVLGSSHNPKPEVRLAPRNAMPLPLMSSPSITQVEAISVGELGGSLKQQSNRDLQSKQQEHLAEPDLIEFSLKLGTACCC